MKFRSLTPALWIPLLCFTAAGAVVFAAFGARRPSQAAAEATPATPTLGPLVDADIGAAKARLLELAFEAASALPENPHQRNRARNQEAVVDACIELDQPVRALGYAEAMSTWRRGNAFAALACHAARHAASAEAERMIQQARTSAAEVERKSLEGETAQGWQRDRIHARIAQAYELLGQQEQAQQFAAASNDAEAVKVASARAEKADASTFDAQLAELDRALATASLDSVRAALDACARLYRRFYADAEKRAGIEQRFADSWKTVPLQVRIELTLTLAGFAAEAGDPAKAKTLVDEARAVFDTAAWAPEDRVALGSRIASARFRAGDLEKARADLDACWALFDAKRGEIVDIYRGKALRALAEACGVLGDEPRRRAAYARAVEEGTSNPNGRPRVDDLVATCCSMACTGFEPDAALMERLERVRAGLGAPW